MRLERNAVSCVKLYDIKGCLKLIVKVEINNIDCVQNTTLCLRVSPRSARVLL